MRWIVSNLFWEGTSSAYQDTVKSMWLLALFVQIIVSVMRIESNSIWIVSFVFENSKYFRRRQLMVKKRVEVPFQKAQNWAEFEEIWDILHWLRKGGRKAGREGDMQYQCLRLSEDNWVTGPLWSFPQVLLQHLWHFSKDCCKGLTFFVIAFGCSSEFNNILK